MRLTPDTIDSALDEVWGAPWREAVYIGPDEDPESYAFKLSRLDTAECGSCVELWQDADLAFNTRLDTHICPTCQAWPGSWSF